MMNLTLEGIFQAKQRRVVMGIPLQIGSMMALGPNRMSNWHFYDLRHEIWLNSKQICHFLFIADFEEFWMLNLS